jgi:hypothetical protein
MRKREERSNPLVVNALQQHGEADIKWVMKKFATPEIA